MEKAVIITMYRWVYTNIDVLYDKNSTKDREFHYIGAKLLYFIEIVHININCGNLKCMLWYHRNYKENKFFK